MQFIFNGVIFLEGNFKLALKISSGQFKKNFESNLFMNKSQIGQKDFFVNFKDLSNPR